MTDLCISSQSSFLLPRSKIGVLHNHPALNFSGGARRGLQQFGPDQPRSLKLAVVSDSRTPSLFSVDSGAKGVVIDPEIGGGGGGGEFGGRGSGGGGGGDGDGDGDGGDSSGGDKGEDGGEEFSEKKGMSMSQKLTLAYALLVGVGGVMGYLKSGSNKSLLAGGTSASLLYLVYIELPKRTVLASSVGLGLSAALLVVMGSRFKRSGKIFPAGVVSLVSLIMTGGYFHGILRGMH